ncbi:MAG TPA: hypothetical protein VN721_11240 [Flavipsychrobacter sp.]|nr:hypothetical protein [Flavipsychrobacter sp.]
MKKIRLAAVFALLGLAAMTSCKKDYTCTCTIVVGGASTTETHSINNATYGDAKRTCNNYETQANNTFPGGTTCHL